MITINVRHFTAVTVLAVTVVGVVVHGLAAVTIPPPPPPHHNRNLASLQDWAICNNGVKLAKGIEIQQVDADADDWTIVVDAKEEEEDDDAFANHRQAMIKAGAVILSVPKHLVVDSENALRGGGLHHQKQLQNALDVLDANNVGNHKAEFLLWLQILQESHKGKASKWCQWLESLPTTFTTGICFDEETELTCLPPFSRALVDHQQMILETFIRAKRKLRSSSCEGKIPSSWLSSQPTAEEGDYDDDDDKDLLIHRWAFNVVYSRCWQLSPTVSHIVPIGDLFNHKEPATISVRYSEDSTSVNFVLLEDIDTKTLTSSDSSTGLYLSYGITNPHRLLVLFGFVDESMPEIFCELVFSNPTKDHIELGCQDRSRMVYRISEGGTALVSDTVWDSVLYALLAQVPDDQEVLMRAHRMGDALIKAKLHSVYALETALTLRNRVVETIGELEDLSTKIRRFQQQAAARSTQHHPNLSLIETHNDFLKSAFAKVESHLNNLIYQERDLRRRGSPSG